MNYSIERARFEKTCDEKFKNTSSMSLLTAAQCGDLDALIYRLDQKEQDENSSNSESRITTCSDEISSENDITDILGQTVVIGKERGYGYTPLHYAAQNGHESCVIHLLRRGFDPNTGKKRICNNKVATKVTVTPLHRACFSGAVPCIKALLLFDADILAKDSSVGDEMTPLHKAVKGGRHLAVRCLLKHARNHITLPTHEHEARNESDQLLNSMLKAKDSLNQTPLQLAIKLNNTLDKDSVSRWDEVAGYRADWKECVNVLSYPDLNMNKNTGTGVVHAEPKSTTCTMNDHSSQIVSKVIPIPFTNNQPSAIPQNKGQVCHFCDRNTISLYRISSKKHSKMVCRRCYREHRTSS